MARLVYSVIASLDGYVADEKGNFDWAEPDEEVHTFGGFRVGLRADGVTATEDRRSGASGNLAYLGVQQLEWRGRLHMFRNARRAAENPRLGTRAGLRALAQAPDNAYSHDLDVVV